MIKTEDCESQYKKTNKTLSSISDISNDHVSLRQKIKGVFIDRDKTQVNTYIKDLESSIAINKEIINSLIIKGSENEKNKETMLLLNKENGKLNLRIKEIVIDRNKCQSKLLIAEQMLADLKGKEKVYEDQMQAKYQELLDQLNRKEYVLQNSQRKLAKVISVLKKYAKTDNEVKNLLKILDLRVNDKRKITNIVEQNAILENEIQTARIKMAEMESKLNELTKRNDNRKPFEEMNENTLKQLIHNKGIPPHSISSSSEITNITTENKALKEQVINLNKLNAVLTTGLSDLQLKNEKLCNLINEMQEEINTLKMSKCINNENKGNEIAIMNESFDAISSIKEDIINEFLNKD